MSWAIWITGPPCSGKSALAQASAAALEARGEPVKVLELDEIRKALTPAPHESDAERDVVHRALVYMAGILCDIGMPVIIDATAHRRAWDELARAEIPRFALVHLECPPEVLRQRQGARAPGHAPRGIGAHAEQPGAIVPGVNAVYEPATAPDLVIDTARENVAAGSARIAALAQSLGHGPLFPARVGTSRWAVWITGRPGSGKSAVAQRVAEAMRAESVPVKVLDVRALTRLLFRGERMSDRQQEIAHRTLAYTAKLLTECGVAAIVDATAPRRAWREAARELIPFFAEVQLLCPVEVCMERERACRWHLIGADRGAEPIDPTPDISVEYEESLRPDLSLRTDLHDLWSTTEQVLFLIHRLSRMTPP